MQNYNGNFQNQNHIKERNQQNQYYDKNREYMSGS